MNGAIDGLNRAAELWWPTLLHAAWQASLLALVVLAIAGLARRWPAPWRFGLLLVALLKFAAPPMLALPTGLFTWAGPVVHEYRALGAKAGDAGSPVWHPGAGSFA